MRTHTLPLAVLLLVCPAIAQAQVHIGIELGLPVAPRLEVVAPGIQVVAGFQEEVFLQGGWYWCRRSDGWYRSRSPQSHFEWIERRRVPGGLVRMPEGRYRNWHSEGPRGGRGPEHREAGRHDRHDDHHDDRRGERHEEHRGERREEGGHREH